MDQGTLVAIAVREKSRSPMVEIPHAEISLETGVANDFRGAPGPRQVTVLATDAWLGAGEELGEEIPWTLRRANLLVTGLNLENTTGGRILIGDVVLEITGETEPCQRMEEQVVGLLAALTPQWRAGVCCRVIRGGSVAPGADVALEKPA